MLIYTHKFHFADTFAFTFMHLKLFKINTYICLPTSKLLYA